MKIDNELIAEFMGIKVRQWGNVLYKCDEDDQIRFDDPQVYNPSKNWNNLMPVVEKIESLLYSFDIRYNVVTVGRQDTEYFWYGGMTNDSKIMSVYIGVAEFIKWYNTQPKGEIKEDVDPNGVPLKDLPKDWDYLK